MTDRSTKSTKNSEKKNLSPLPLLLRHHSRECGNLPSYTATHPRNQSFLRKQESPTYTPPFPRMPVIPAKNQSFPRKQESPSYTPPFPRNQSFLRKQESPHIIHPKSPLYGCNHPSYHTSHTHSPISSPARPIF